MSVVQTNTWTCDFCGAVTEDHPEVNQGADVLVIHPSGWGEPFIPADVRKSDAEIACDACPDCALDPDWSKYQARRDKL